MRRFILILGCFAAVIGGLASVIHGFSSALALFDRSKSMTDEMLMTPLYWTYGLIMNGALFVVFGRATRDEDQRSLK